VIKGIFKMVDKKYDRRKYLKHYEGTPSSPKSVYDDVGIKPKDVFDRHKIKSTIHYARNNNLFMARRASNGQSDPT